MKFVKLLVAAIALTCGSAGAAPPPNVIIILADDLGYGDLACYDPGGHRTPNLDRMAAEGIRFTHFYAAAPVCSASRAALLSGCYPQRVGVPGNIGANAGMHASVKLLPEILKEQGYRTAIIGKWHLGQRREFLPLRRGFDEYFGTPASNDMAHANDDPSAGVVGRGLLLYENDRVIEIDPDQAQLPSRYTSRAVGFIERNKDRPFFLYYAMNAPHTPLAAGAKYRGVSRRGLYGDVMAEMDACVGEILAAIQRCGIGRNTLVMFTSDNGPWLIFGDHGGSAGPFRGGKKQTIEGGMRVPCIMRWPGRLPAGRVCDQLTANLDLLPTIVKITGGRLRDQTIDGYDLWPMLSGPPDARSPRSTLYYFWQNDLHAVRSGRWKLQLAHTDTQAPDPQRIGHGGARGEIMRVAMPVALYDLENDPGEKTDLAAQHPEVVRQMQALAQDAHQRLKRAP